MKRTDIFFNVALVPLDFAMLLAGALFAYVLRVSGPVTELRPVLFDMPLAEFLVPAAFVSAWGVMLLALSGLYAMRGQRSFFQEVVTGMIAISAGMALVIVFLFFNLTDFDSRFILLAAWGFALVMWVTGRLAMRIVRRILLVRKGLGVDQVVIIGTGDSAEQLKRNILNDKRLGKRFLAHIEIPNIDLLRSLHAHRVVHQVVVASRTMPRPMIMELVSFCEEHRIQFSYTPDALGSLVTTMHVSTLGDTPLVSLAPTPLDGWGRVVKRIIDIIGALAGLVVFSPIFLVAAFAIKWETSGPVLERLRRMSQGKEFDLYKFRSMIQNARKYKWLLVHLNERTDGPLFKIANDPRVTRVGRWLRAHRYDELPQFLNVLRGEMSLVGPRPHEPEEVARYEQYHKKVFAVKAGITGFSQVSGASDLPFEEEIALDHYYIGHWSLMLDLQILLKTAWMFFFDRKGI
ncbi:MAG: sugar transferase [Candidatus Spechtbacterales bacterium]